MAHIHKVYDNDVHFKIDAVTRVVKNASETKVMIVQHDHNSERFTFEIPRFIDGHDMSTCNVVQVHYINTDSAHKDIKFCGIYEVDDLRISPDDEDIVICSWLVSGNATQCVGKLSFILRFVCSAEGELDYAWNTAVHSNVFVSSGIYNGDDVVEEYADVLEQWREELFGGSSGIVRTVNGVAPDENGNVEVEVSDEYTLPIGGAELGGVKNGGNVTINEDGTMSADIPTDEHINELINTALGVIENGTY